MVYVFHHHIAKSSDQKLFDIIFDSFPSPIRSAILKYKNWEDRNRSIAGKALLVEAMKILGADHRLDKMKYTKYNRPYFNDSIDFNISHSQNFIVCAISKTCRVGIDVERIKPIVLEDFQQNFSNEDWKKVINAEDRLQAFYSLWTKRESFLKAVGTGFFQQPTEINFDSNKIMRDGHEWTMQEISLHKNYCCYITVNQTSPKIQLQEIKFN